MATKKGSKAPAKSTKATAPKAAPKSKAAPKAKAAKPAPKAAPKPTPPTPKPKPKATSKPLDGYTVTFVHPGNRTMALQNAKAACKRLGAEIGNTEIPRQLVSTTRLNNAYGPSLEVAQTVVNACKQLHLRATEGDPTEKGVYVFID